MIYRKGEIVHEKLSAEYTDVPQLLSSLTSGGFAGIVEVNGPTSRGAFFLAGGKIINAVLGPETDPKGTVGEEAIEQLMSLSSEPSTFVNVYRLAAREVEFFASTLACKVVFKDLSTDFVRFDRFLQKLANEKQTGYIEIFTKQNRPIGMLSLRDGEAEGFLVTGDFGRSSFFEQKAVPALLGELSREGAIFTVYKSTSNVQPQATVSEQGRNEFLAGLQRIFARIEKFLDGGSQRGGFQRAFKRACIEKADSYPFLDPFEGLFNYESGEMRLDVSVSLEDFAIGLADCLNRTFSYLQKELPGNTAFPSGLKDEIEHSFKHYDDLLKRSGMKLPVPPGVR